MNDDLIRINHHLGRQIEILTKKLDIGIIGLNAIISDGSDNLHIAEKTLRAIEEVEEGSPQEPE